MARNMAKRFATMTLLYWKPIHGGSGLSHETPVEFKGFYIGSAGMDPDDTRAFISSMSGRSDNLVLFYMLKPEVNGYVSWEHTLESLNESGEIGLPPSDMKETFKIQNVTNLVMLRSKKTTLENSAFIASVE